ncbi:MAG: hypothetical protein ACRDHN_13730, partial [Thermomicrobiales bacterium]
MLSDRTIDFGESFTTALLGLDALYAAEQQKPDTDASSDIERLVVLNMSTTHQPDSFAGYDEAIARFQELSQLAGALPELDRQVYYRETSESAIAFAEWRSMGLPFADQISRFLHVPGAPPQDGELDRLRLKMSNLLTELGYSGSLDARFSAWESRHRVPTDEIVGTLESLLDEAWDRTAELIEIPAEKSDYMRVSSVSGVPFNAQCDFAGRTIRLNVDPILTVPSLRHLAVHEGCPGHYLQFKRREASYLAGHSPADGLLSVVNTASSSPFEGIADHGLSVIGWDRNLDGKLASILARYRSGIGTRAAWRLHAEGWEPAQVREELLRDALVGGEGWVDNRIKFIDRADRSALI